MEQRFIGNSGIRIMSQDTISRMSRLTGSRVTHVVAPSETLEGDFSGPGYEYCFQQRQG